MNVDSLPELTSDEKVVADLTGGRAAVPELDEPPLFSSENTAEALATPKLAKELPVLQVGADEQSMKELSPALKKKEKEKSSKPDDLAVHKPASSQSSWVQVKEVQEKSPFSATEVELLTKRFQDTLDQNGNKVLSFEEFAAHLGQLGVQQPKLVNRLFQVFDVDGNGSVDLKEFLAGVAACTKGALEDRMRLCFKLYDLDQDGYITRLELREMLRSYLVGSARVACQVVEVMELDDFDEDFDDGPSGTVTVMAQDNIDANKRLEIESTVTEFEQEIFKADENRDGKLTLEEWLAWVKSPETSIMDQRLLTKWMEMFGRDLAGGAQ